MGAKHAYVSTDIHSLCTQKFRNLLIHKGFSPGCGHFAHSANGSRSCDDPDLIHIPLTPNPQVVPRLVHADSPGCPQVIHTCGSSLTRAIPAASAAPRAWVQLGPNLGTSLGTTKANCG
ncbi:hypothetical protein GCM10027360_13600 [Amycolatopsis echigonensis]